MIGENEPTLELATQGGGGGGRNLKTELWPTAHTNLSLKSAGFSFSCGRKYLGNEAFPKR